MNKTARTVSTAAHHISEKTGIEMDRVLDGLSALGLQKLEEIQADALRAACGEFDEEDAVKFEDEPMDFDENVEYEEALNVDLAKSHYDRMVQGVLDIGAQEHLMPRHKLAFVRHLLGTNGLVKAVRDAAKTRYGYGPMIALADHIEVLGYDDFQEEENGDHHVCCFISAPALDDMIWHAKISEENSYTHFNLTPVRSASFPIEALTNTAVIRAKIFILNDLFFNFMLSLNSLDKDPSQETA